MTRNELIKAALAAWDDALSPPLLYLTPADRVGVVVDAVEPLIRADERAQAPRDGEDPSSAWHLEYLQDQANALRAKFEALPTVEVDGVLYVGMVWWQDVLALLDGDGDD